MDIPVLPMLKDRLKWARERKRLNKKQLALLAGLAPPVYLKLERGDNKSTNKIVELALCLDVNPTWLATGTSSPNDTDVIKDSESADSASLQTWQEVINGRESARDKFRLQIHGDAMVGGKSVDIPSGAVLDVERSGAGTAHTVQIANLMGSPIIGVLDSFGGKQILVPYNPRYPTTEVNTEMLIGEVIGFYVSLKND